MYGVQPIVFEHPSLDLYVAEAANRGISLANDDKDSAFDLIFCGESAEDSHKTLRGDIVLPNLAKLGFSDMTGFASQFDVCNYYKDSTPDRAIISFTGVHGPQDKQEKTKNIIPKFSAGGVLYSKGKYLTIIWASEGTVELPKGTIEDGETAEQACVREVLEETGYNVRVSQHLTESNFVIDWHDGNTYKKNVQYYLLERTDDLEPTPSRMSHEDFTNQWLSGAESYGALTYDDAKLAMQKAIEILNNRETRLTAQ